MKAVVEPLDGNLVKLSVEVDEAEFEEAVDAAFRRIAREVRIPGFRPGKAPRRLLEARLGASAAREEAFREALPAYYSQAVRDHDVDVIDSPKIEITGGEASGPIAFDAVVEIRPRIIVPGYAGLRVTVPRPEASLEEIDAQIERLRDQFGDLSTVERPVQDGDHVSMNIVGSRAGEPLAGLSADDYLYEVGGGGIAPEVDVELRGAKAGDILEFAAQPADPDEDPVDFRVLVKEVKEKVLPAVDDEWANEVSEFDTLEELRSDFATRIGSVRQAQAQAARREQTVAALVALVEEAPPKALVDAEMQQRLQDLAMRLSAQGISADQYLSATGRTQEQMTAELRELATNAVKADLALRAVSEAEGIGCTDEDVEREIEALAQRLEEKPAKLREQFERAGTIVAVRSDIATRHALDWLVARVEIVDEDGHPIERAAIDALDEDEEPVVDEPLVKEPLVDEPLVEAPVAQEPVVQESGQEPE